MITAVAALTLVIWLALAFGWHGFWKTDQRLPDAGKDDGNWPHVCVLVPARNEVETIGRCINSLARQNYAGTLNIIVINDSSTDDTANAARSAGSGKPNIVVIDAPPLKPGWAGKLWALHQGVLHAQNLAPDYFWLCDADIEHGPEVLTNLTDHADREQLGLCSLMVKLRCQGVWERLLVPAFIFFFSLLYPFRAVNAPRSSIAGAAGGCMLLKTDTLAAIGGLELLKGAVIDDCTLAKAVKRSGERIWLGLADDSRSLRGYDRLAGFWAMVVRSAFTQLKHSLLLLTGATFGLALTYLAPLFIVFAVPFTPAGALSGVALAIMCMCYWPTVRYYRLSVIWALTLPISAALFGAMTIHSAIRHYTGRGVAWKGRSIKTQ